MQATNLNNVESLGEQVGKLTWYHTIDFGNGIVTPGIYDHRPLLYHYGFPESLVGKTVLDIGTASGFFAFEFEKRGASKVVATDLPRWTDHDVSPEYRAQLSDEEFGSYLKDPFSLAQKALNSKVTKKEISIYEISPETVGEFDVVFCGSLLQHLTDPIKALFNIREVTREQAIVATMVDLLPSEEPRALLLNQVHEMSWWAPNLTCLVRMVKSAGFEHVEIVSTFNLVSVDGTINVPHAVIRAWVDWPEANASTGSSSAKNAVLAVLASRQADPAVLGPIPWWVLLRKAWEIMRQEGIKAFWKHRRVYARLCLKKLVVTMKHRLDRVEANLSDY
jgi:tRNA (mo5U34)-methyltransferase